MINAHADYSQRLLRLSELISIDKSSNNAFGTTRADKRDLVVVLRESLSILPVSYYEDYLKILVSQFISALNSANPQTQWNDLPESIRKTHLFDSDLNYSKKVPNSTSYSSHEQSTFRELKRITDKMLSPFANPSFYEINSEPFKKTYSNPDPETTNKLFNRIGIKDVFSDTNFISTMVSFDPKFNSREVIRRELSSIVEHRHVVAHGGSIFDKPVDELETNINFLDKVGEALESVCRIHFSKISPTTAKNHNTSDENRLKRFILRTPLKSAIKSIYDWLEN